eukprot:NODE_823_length_688_cov_2.397496_g753_i0.p4 GENE.NODE_823_length_688_cov_2.397496_g753_i0~~NODE_823_length_688_cov_2.397496_g753_i0.p4  ORF type:complete len:64 (-),score=19.32 NODE_823_length_688_cov_2.397496_g753_i0:56-247(-)
MPFDPIWVTNTAPMKLTTQQVTPSEVRWNFEKFLVDKSGKPVQRFRPKVGPGDIADSIAALLK